MNEKEIADVLGREGIQKIVQAFYRRVPSDTILGPMYPEGDMEGAEQRLLDFLLFRLTGDPTYLDKRGHPRLRARHMSFQIGMRERDRWVRLMDEAMGEVGVRADVKNALHDFFFQVADFMRNQNERGGIHFTPRS